VAVVIVVLLAAIEAVNVAHLADNKVGNKWFSRFQILLSEISMESNGRIWREFAEMRRLSIRDIFQKIIVYGIEGFWRFSERWAVESIFSPEGIIDKIRSKLHTKHTEPSQQTLFGDSHRSSGEAHLTFLSSSRRFII
jgi:hypothetical protein